MSASLQSYQNELIEHAMAVNALKFGSFTLKSGRISPYFINAGLLNTGPILAILSRAYAATIIAAMNDSTPFPEFDVLFGPAYKGIPFAACTALQLYTLYQIETGFAYDRKEAKDHGEGGNMIGVSIQGKRVVVLDDVMTSGKAVRGAMDIVTRAGGQVVGVVQLLDREEVGQDGKSSTVSELEAELGVGRVRSILKLRDLIAWLEVKGMRQELKNMEDYRKQYGTGRNK